MTSTTAPAGPAAQPWWHAPQTLSRYLRDLLQAEMAPLRPQGWPLPAAGWHEALHWVDDLGADSLELLALSTALADAVGLRDADAADALHATPTLAGWTAAARQALEADGQRLGFRTSGSTGAPKSCRHALPDLLEEVQALAALLGAAGHPPVRRIVSAVRSHHIYGFLFTVLLPEVLAPPQDTRNAAGGAPAPLPVLSLVGRSPAALAASLQAGDLVIGFPDWWRAVARLPLDWPAGVTGVTSTAPCPADVAQALAEAGLARLFQIYGSSETAGVGWRLSPDQPYRLHAFWQRVPEGLAGDGDTAAPSRLRRRTADGREVVVALQDEIAWHDARHFRPGPRRDGAVQVGGVNVHPGAVRERLLRHPAVADAAVRLHDFAGQPRLKAFVVPRTDAAADNLAADLLAWTRRHLAPAARPVHCTVGPALPVNAQGKPCDWALDHSAPPHA